jgi:hypothetical protein
LIPSLLLDSLIQSGFKDLSIPRHRELDAAGDAADEPVTAHADLLDVVSSNLNNDFEHECLDLAIRRLGAKRLEARGGDLGPIVMSIPGIPNGRFLPHQVWGIWFLVARVVSDTAPVALLADDMGLGKTYTALGALLHLKWILSEASAGRELACIGGRSVEDLDNVPPFFGSEKEIYMRPSIVMVPANLMGTWANAIESLLQGTGLKLVNLNADRTLTSGDLNLTTSRPERGLAVHLVSYTTYRVRYTGTLAGCCWGVGIFDESHNVRSPSTILYRALMGMDVRGKFQLTGTPMYHNVNSWVVQADWLFAQVDEEARLRQGPERLRDVLASARTGEISLEEAYMALKTIAHPWLIRRWAESKTADGQPLVALIPHVTEDVRLSYTEEEGARLEEFITTLKDDKRGHVATVIHEWRLACLSMDLPGNDTLTNGADVQYRQEWDQDMHSPGPAIRWLRDTLVPILLGEGANGLPNKAVIFAPLPGQAWYVHWHLSTFHSGLKSFIYHAGIPRTKRDELLNEFSSADAPAALVLTPALGGTGLNLVAANHVVILQRFWVLNEQRQAIGRIDRLGQQRTPTAWVLHCVGSVDDRAEELHILRAVYEARVMHGLIGADFTYKELHDACEARREAIAKDRASAGPPLAESPPYRTPTPGHAPREETPASDG